MCLNFVLKSPITYILLSLVAVAACSKDTRNARELLTGTWEIQNVELVDAAPDSSYYSWSTDTVSYETDSMITIANSNEDSSWTDTFYIEFSLTSDLESSLFEGISYVFGGCQKMKSKCDGGYQYSFGGTTTYCPMTYQIKEDGSVVDMKINFYGNISNESWTGLTFETDSNINCFGNVTILQVNAGDTVYQDLDAMLSLERID